MNVELVREGNVIAKYGSENLEGNIPFDQLRKYWSYANEEDTEWGTVESLDDENIIGILTTGSDQGGVVFIWNIKEEKFVHISEGAYAIGALLVNEKVYTLRYVHYWGVKDYIAWGETPLNTLDAITEVDLHKIENLDYHGDEISMHIDLDKVTIIYRGKVYH